MGGVSWFAAQFVDGIERRRVALPFGIQDAEVSGTKNRPNRLTMGLFDGGLPSTHETVCGPTCGDRCPGR
jgi:hypothetical protein